jgi:hypothetical protein
VSVIKQRDMRPIMEVAEDIQYARALPQATQLLRGYIREVIEDIVEHIDEGGSIRSYEESLNSRL